MPQQTKTTIETDSLLVLWDRSPLCAWCPKCAVEGKVVPIEGVGGISNLGPSEVEAWLQSEAIHHSQAADGAPLVCLKSLRKRFQTKTAKRMSA